LAGDVHTSILGSNEYSVGKNEENTTLVMINNFIRNGIIKSKYMTPEEEDYLTANIRYCNLLSRNSGGLSPASLKRSNKKGVMFD
jgi:hypothetical protein